jgi:hypothetical protein
MLKTHIALLFCSIFALVAMLGDSNGPTSAEASTLDTLPNALSQMADNDFDKQFLKNLPKEFVLPRTETEKLLLREYGAVFVARGGAVPPATIVFRDDAEVDKFQSSVKNTTTTISGTSVRLQTAALNALLDAIEDAKKQHLSIGPRSSDSSTRDYEHTVDLWASRVNPGLAYWTAKGKITKSEAARIKKLTPFEQVPVILGLEQAAIYFAKSLDKSIIYSVAPPGTSQHLSMLALDVKEFENAKVRAILAKHGWYQTVTSDLPHFTYIGVAEDQLPKLGLKKVENSGRIFWVPLTK